MSTATTECVEQRGARSVTRRAGVVLTAVVAAVAAWCVFDLLLGVDLAVESGASVSAVGLADVALTALLVGCAGWGLLGLIERRRGSSRRPWTIVAVTVFALSLLGPLAAASPGAGVGLLCLHFVVGLTIVFGLRRTAC